MARSTASPPIASPTSSVAAPTKSTPASAESPASPAATPPAVIVRIVHPLGRNLQLSFLKGRPVKLYRILDGALVLKLEVREPLGLAGEFVADDRHALDGPAGLEVGEELLGSRGVVHLADVYRVPVLLRPVRRGGRLGFVRLGGVRAAVLGLFEVLRLLCYPRGLLLHTGDLGLQLFQVFLLLAAPVVVGWIVRRRLRLILSSAHDRWGRV
mmetsp:Transcript_19432/g.44507  ORF Transcript_19432/g.44507 Transcript_19432/m.44507 type:complete len:212 (+) Transcript_19432:3-638(+)